MLFSALACDFDGTLASEDRIGPAAREALARARAAGLRLILVTGRTFFELTRVCECLDLFDAVVAENGAVLYDPHASTIRDQGPPPPTRLLAELDRRGIYYQVGRVIVGTPRADEARVREALDATGVSRQLVYNRAALMLLPAGVSKGSGLEQALQALRLSPHDTLALGDAENDLPLFEVAGWRACPENAVQALRAAADWVFPGEDGDGLAAAITGPILGGSLPVARSPRHRIPIGWVVETSEPVTIPARGVNVLIHGDPLSGKSWLAGALVERLVQARYTVCVIDPEGDYRVLGRLPGVERTEAREVVAVERALERLAEDPAASVVVDLSDLAHTRKVRAVEAALARVRELRARTGRPHWVVLDEAHYSLHPDGVADETLAVEDRGFCLATYRPSWLRERVVRTIDVWALARTTMEEELDFLCWALGRASGALDAALMALPDVPEGEFVLLQEAAAGGDMTAVTFVAMPRATAHVRHLGKYADSPGPAERRFLFRRADGLVVAEADSLGAFRRALAAVDEAVLDEHAARGDFSRWVLDVFSDRDLARRLGKLEARWRRKEMSALRRALDRLIALRYGGMG